MSVYRVTPSTLTTLFAFKNVLSLIWTMDSSLFGSFAFSGQIEGGLFNRRMLRMGAGSCDGEVNMKMLSVTIRKFK